MKNHICMWMLSLSLGAMACASNMVEGTDRRALGKADSYGSCENACGGPSEGNCWCDELCSTYGDCCADWTNFCSADDVATACEEAGGTCTALVPGGCDGQWGDQAAAGCGDAIGVGCCLPATDPAPMACEDAGGTCVGIAPGACAGVWADNSESSCGGGLGVGCCLPGSTPDPGPVPDPTPVACEDAGGTCVGLAPGACDGLWANADTHSCGDAVGVGCCIAAAPSHGTVEVSYLFTGGFTCTQAGVQWVLVSLGDQESEVLCGTSPVTFADITPGYYDIDVTAWDQSLWHGVSTTYHDDGETTLVEVTLAPIG